MFYLLLVSVLFEDPLPSLNWWAVSVGGEELKWCQLAHHEPAKDLILVHIVQLKPTIKAQISGRMVVYVT